MCIIIVIIIIKTMGVEDEPRLIKLGIYIPVWVQP